MDNLEKLAPLGT